MAVSLRVEPEAYEAWLDGDADVMVAVAEPFDPANFPVIDWDGDVRLFGGEAVMPAVAIRWDALIAAVGGVSASPRIAYRDAVLRAVL